MKTIKAREHYDEPVTESVLEHALVAGRKRRGTTLHATDVWYLADFQALLVGFADKTAVALPIGNYPELAGLSRPELEHLTLGFGGSALCLEERDLHVSIAGLVSASEPLMDMATTVVTARNGSRSSDAKAQAARENGLLGGRPRKSVSAG